MNLTLQIGRKEFEKLKNGIIKEYYLPVNYGNSSLLCAPATKNHFTEFKPYETVTFRGGFADDAPFLSFKVKYLGRDIFNNYIPEGMEKGDTAYTIELGERVSL